MYTIDIDTGGTFTDGYVAGPERKVGVKVDTTPHDLTLCFWNCIESGARAVGLATSELLAQTRVVRFSSTIATNAAVQLSGPKLGVIVTRGAEDTLYGVGADNPLFAFLPARLVVGLDEEVDASGRVVRAPSTDEIEEKARAILEQGARMVVICLANAHHNPANEKKVRAVLEASYPRHYLGAVPMLASHQISMVPDDALRTNTAVINAYFHRSLAQSLYKAEDLVRNNRYRHPLMVVTADFGCTRVAKTRAINAYQSGPAACVRGAGVTADALGHAKVLVIDVGGTTSDVAYIANGRPNGASQRPIRDVDVLQRIPDIISYGVGGGSKIRAKGGALSVGPDSQGAVPGPAAFGLGGSMATPTDVWLALGLIEADAYLGGRKKLKAELARGVIEKQIAAPLGCTVGAAALAAKEAVEARLAAYIREGRFLAEGADFSDVTLYAVGGGGGLLTVGVAEKLGAGSAYFPLTAPVFSAFGASTLDVAHHYEAILPAGAEMAAIEAKITVMTGEAARDMRGEGFLPADVDSTIEATVYQGREPAGGIGPLPLGEEAMTAIGALVGTAGRGAGYIELRLTATGRIPHPVLAALGARAADADGALAGSREIITPEGRVRAPVYRFDELPIGAAIAGPAIAETEHTSILVPAGRTLEIDSHGGGVVEITS
ncbi:hydantoinase/oxoprolinase family protein [Ancylobacter pratisalsi]|uniref:Hydantoinase/oxoprolinase family protein n=1 Tax=Ancylobacter pratisalsi TaxID=1745854 RepID=A0A6P1YND1_9HYPH|nr:hydantoinase/oxoprolinase family protein [Ancylobacter pratisalsi]QIB34221.1 hydantoinase/oxoprolinase family protein [Ancylobacter pratisalsi]